MIKQTLRFCSAILIMAGALVSEEPNIHDEIHSPTNTYTIQKELGEGAFGKVFAVTDSSGKEFAMKWYKGNSGSDGFMQHLSEGEREFEIGQLLSHPNIIASHEYFSDEREESHYLILDLVHGNTLYKTPKKSLPSQNARALATQLTEAMQYAYNLGFIHLDLHSGNLMVESNSDLKVIDLASFFSWEELNVLLNGNKNVKGFAEETLEDRIDQNFGPKRAEILKQFLKNNHVPLENSGMNEKGIDLFKDKIKKYWIPYWFNCVTDAEVSILLKSNMKPDVRINLRANIKKVSWRYEEEDAEKNKFIPLDPFFDKLDRLLN